MVEKIIKDTIYSYPVPAPVLNYIDLPFVIDDGVNNFKFWIG